MIITILYLMVMQAVSWFCGSCADHIPSQKPVEGIPGIPVSVNIGCKNKIVNGDDTYMILWYFNGT